MPEENNLVNLSQEIPSVKSGQDYVTGIKGSISNTLHSNPQGHNQDAALNNNQGRILK